MTIHSDVKKGYLKGYSGLQVLLCGHLGKTKFITISPTNYQQFKESYPSLPQKMIRNGRALPVPSDNTVVKDEISSLKPKKNALVFIHVARCAEVKNQELLIKSFNNIVEKGYNAILLVIGDNYESDIGIKLQSMSCSHIHFLGVKENVYDYLLNSDMFLLTSFVEGMPMSIIESLLVGIPVISTPVCGAVDAIINGYNGFISSDFSIQNYAETIIRGIKNIDLLKKNTLMESSQLPWNMYSCAKQYLQWFKN